MTWRGVAGPFAMSVSTIGMSEPSGRRMAYPFSVMVNESILSEGARKMERRRSADAASEKSALIPSATPASTSRVVVPSGLSSTLSVSES